jgi:hypothetical protein
MYLGCLPFIAIPALTLVQWLVVRGWFKREAFILWFGASVCSFPVSGFLAIVITFLADPDSKSFLVDLPLPIAPVFWLMGGFYGLFTGLALALGAPELYRSWRLRDHIAGTVLGVAIAGFAAILVHDLSNTLAGYDLLHGRDDSSLYMLRVMIYLALGFSLGRYQGVRIAVAISFIIAAADVLLDVTARSAMSRFEGSNSIILETWTDFSRYIAVPVVVWTILAALGAAFSHTRFLRSVSRSHVYRVKL